MFHRRVLLLVLPAPATAGVGPDVEGLGPERGPPVPEPAAETGAQPAEPGERVVVIQPAVQVLVKETLDRDQIVKQDQVVLVTFFYVCS